MESIVSERRRDDPEHLLAQSSWLWWSVMSAR
jgi:hypothetical protein